MRGARSAATETYQVDRRGSEHRATKQMVPAAVFQQPANAGAMGAPTRAGRNGGQLVQIGRIDDDESDDGQ